MNDKMQTESSSGSSAQAAILARARELVPVLSERAAKTEANRSLLPETEREFRQAGFFRMVQPPRFGGLGFDIPAQLEVIAEVARGCASSSWIVGLVSMQNWMIGYYDERAQREVFGTDGDIIASAVQGPTAMAEPVEGGHRVSSRWPYVSGCDQADWLMLSTLDSTVPEGETPRVFTHLVPRADIEIVDDWFILGLRGTGSKTVALDGAFVPEHRTLPFFEADIGSFPGQAVNPGPMYNRVPRITYFAMVVTAPALGVAQAAIDAYRDSLFARKIKFATGSLAESQTAQIRISHAAAKLKVARQAFFAAARDFTDRLGEPDLMADELRVDFRMQMAEIQELCRVVVSDLFLASGTSVAREGSAMERLFRDIHVIRSHLIVDPDSSGENHGRMLVGFPAIPPLI